ncbi:MULTISPECIES: glutaredoxin family protein [Geobacillus]|jgi:glutaredoxin|uniref:Glutaredoxin family protein n=2 Tax=Geobacillus thermoleovorans group TaxID=1505648 RepID=A0A2Z3N7E5_GEOTH|nr:MULTISPECIES: glutaredoxin family protein [Geobacillus]ALA69991.1 glutaredoxin [Geobacillus stearothermophilus 10]KDE46079.1 glutaredoxin [Geobacillus sp. CAMR12739]ADU95525.1 glutaredoxin 2 [Geobacillus sp. Y412MC52]AWO74802.1 glutaredoxin family protein [Geobacillus thermoleovorans]KDE46689.1 glutaredoxin [Geobacillus sp. CAMR5420]
MHIRLYTKTNCPLCDKAKAVLTELLADYSFTLEEIDIYKDDELLEKYQLMIPVVELDGEEIGYGAIEKEAVRKRLRRAQNS